MVVNSFFIVVMVIIATSHLSSPNRYDTEFISESVSLILNFIKTTAPDCELAFATDFPINTPILDIFFSTFSLSLHAGTFNVDLTFSGTLFQRFSDPHKLASGGACTTVIIVISSWSNTHDLTLFNLLTPAYTSITKKDEDYFFFVSPDIKLLDRALLSPRFGAKIKFKLGLVPGAATSSNTLNLRTVDFYGAGKGSQIISLEVAKPSRISQSSVLFPDFTKNFRGFPLKLAIPKAPFRFDIALNSKDGRYHPKRGTYKPWLESAISKLNFTYDCFYSSFEGGTGIQFPNGSWVGAVADVRDGRADMAFFIAHIYNRHKVVDWSVPLSYEWIVFVSHKPSYSYSPYAILWPFDVPVWLGFLLSIFLTAFALKFIASILFRIIKDPRLNIWNFGNALSYIFTTFLEQDREGPSRLPFHPIRIVSAFWLMFAIVTANAYRAKLVSVMAFPVPEFTPRTYEQLVDSHYGAGMHVIGKGDAAYTIFQQGRGRVYEGIFKRLQIIDSPLKCLLKAVHEDFGCLMWEGLNDYLNAKNISKRGVGREPTQVSLTKTSFINDGLIYERRAIIRKQLDETILRSRDSGLTKKWVDMDLDGIRKERFEWEMSQEAKGVSIDHSLADTGPQPLGMSNILTSVYILIVGLILGGIIFSTEFTTRRVKCLLG